MISRHLAAASTKPLILAILLNGENYGYQIIQKVKSLSGGDIDWADGMLYPVLHRLEKDGFVITSWKISTEGRKRKYYSITSTGKKELNSDMKQWLKVDEIFQKILGPIPQFTNS